MLQIFHRWETKLNSEHEPFFYILITNFWYFVCFFSKTNTSEEQNQWNTERKQARECIHFDTLNVSVCEGFINIKYAQYTATTTTPMPNAVRFHMRKNRTQTKCACGYFVFVHRLSHWNIYGMFCIIRMIDFVLWYFLMWFMFLMRALAARICMCMCVYTLN